MRCEKHTSLLPGSVHCRASDYHMHDLALGQDRKRSTLSKGGLACIYVCTYVCKHTIPPPCDLYIRAGTEAAFACPWHDAGSKHDLKVTEQATGSCKPIPAALHAILSAGQPGLTY